MSEEEKDSHFARKGGSNWLISNDMRTSIFVLWIRREIISTNYSIPTFAAQKPEC